MGARARGRRERGGFTLLEVMVAIAILGLTLTVILSAQGGLAASNKSANNMGIATSLGRCKMTELEERLLKLGYPEVDDLQTEVACCDDKSDGRFTCDTRVEKVVLPNPPDNTLDGGAMSLTGPAGSAGAGGGAGAAGLGGLAQALGPAGSAGLNFDGGLQALGSIVGDQLGTGAGAGGASGMLSMVMGIVYPSLKLMMEASIRRVTVTVHWKEGPNAKELGIVQYVTNPQRGGFQSGVAGGDGGVGGTPGMPGMPGMPGVPGAGGGAGGFGSGLNLGGGVNPLGGTTR